MPYSDPEQYRAYQAAYRASHRDDNKAYQKVYRAENLERLNAYDRQRYARDRALIRERQRQFRLEDPARARAWSRASYRRRIIAARQENALWRESHPEQMRSYRAAWKRRHPESAVQCRRVRKARIRGASICDFTVRQWQEMKHLYGDRCAYCGKKTAHLTQDHIQPVSRGGDHTASNIVPACRACNCQKGARAPIVPARKALPL